ncbi:tRNA dihydrouridine(20/20a) synthase DusA [Pseudoroseicyclus sp. CXY001]|uniref:tRNA dihydrouridine(20/20a) synthase DusA n=1 Tax=Pseudoroseicyclus sp. CXY001 TaxID=3242492 RepID=UPI0035709747
MTAAPLSHAARLSVAPMMDWTDRHCRFFHRKLTARALLYTEMVTADAVIHGDRERLIGFHPAEMPVALQLGGSEPAKLAEAVRIGAERGYPEVNLNCGCPSDRVQSGAFGAVLMLSPDLVADCAAAMIAAAPGAEITVKCRVGVDEQEPREVLPDFLEKVSAAGVTRFAIHARKAWLQGLSPKENRDIPPLDYDLVDEMKRAFPGLHISLNGGLATLADAKAALARGLDGAMIGRAAYHDPGSVLAPADPAIWGEGEGVDPVAAALAMLPYIEDHLAAGGRLHQVTRHMLGLFQGRPGARAWRRMLSEGASREGAGPELVETALSEVTARAA